MSDERKQAAEHIRWLLSMLGRVPCFQGCVGGTIQHGYDEAEQCEWCGRQEDARTFADAIDPPAPTGNKEQ